MGFRPFLLAAALVCGAFALCMPAQGAAASGGSRDGFFSGSVTALSTDGITVTRSVLGDNSSVRRFTITPETRIEGDPRLHAKVTVRFVAEEEADRAVHIIVRSPAPPRKKR